MIRLIWRKWDKLSGTPQEAGIVADEKLININGFPVPFVPVDSSIPYRYQRLSVLPPVKRKSADLQEPQEKPAS
jgi:hypothetical protein